MGSNAHTVNAELVKRMMLDELPLMKEGYWAICIAKNYGYDGNVLRRAARIFLDEFGYRDRRVGGAVFNEDAVYLALVAIDRY